jgi:broad specificity phosphatase PhoE
VDHHSESEVNIYLVRHGQTELNAAGVLRGHLDPPLDTVGQREARLLARALAPLHPDLIVSSPLLRAVATAQAIASACGLNVKIDEAFIDRDYGDWAGHTLEEVEAQFQTIDNAPGVELHTAAQIRARKALELVADQAKAVGVVVAHDAINRLLINAVEPEHFAKIEEIAQPTGCLNQLQRSGSTWSVMRVGIHPQRLIDELAGHP